MSCLMLLNDAHAKTCKDGQHLFQGKCVKVPKHADPSDEHPGWKCHFGYTMAHFRCKKVSVPKHATLNEDGIAWSCNEGYKPYRGTCIKE